MLVRKTNTADLIREGLLEIGDGYRAKNNEFVPEGGLPFVRVADVRPGRIVLEGSDELPMADRDRYEPKVSRPLDSLITMKGTVGRVAFVKADLRRFVYSPQISYWRVLDPSVIHARWLRYWLESPEFVSQSVAAKGATDMADYINLRDQRRMLITLPPIEEQNEIAGALGAIDDMLENNQLRIEALEALASNRFRELLRHSNNQAYPYSSSSSKAVDWEVALVADLMLSRILDVGDGYRAKNSEMTDEPEGLPFVRVANIKDGHLDLKGCDRLPPSYAGTLGSKVSRPGDVVVSMKGTVGRCALLGFGTPQCVYSPQASWWRSLDDEMLPPEYLYAWIRSDSFQTQCAAAKGATDMADYVNLKDQRRMRIPLPPAPLMASFVDTARPIFALAMSLRAATSRLQELRCQLLPRLMSGQIRLSGTDHRPPLESVG